PRGIWSSRDEIVAITAQRLIRRAGPGIFGLLAKRLEVSACQSAVKSDEHDPTGREAVQQPVPGSERIGHVMKHARTFDDTEASAPCRHEGVDLLDVAKREGKVPRIEAPGHEGGIGEAGRRYVEPGHVGFLSVVERARNSL